MPTRESIPAAAWCAVRDAASMGGHAAHSSGACIPAAAGCTVSMGARDRSAPWRCGTLRTGGSEGGDGDNLEKMASKRDISLERRERRACSGEGGTCELWKREGGREEVRVNVCFGGGRRGDLHKAGAARGSRHSACLWRCQTGHATWSHPKRSRNTSRGSRQGPCISGC